MISFIIKSFFNIFSRQRIVPNRLINERKDVQVQLFMRVSFFRWLFYLIYILYLKKNNLILFARIHVLIKKIVMHMLCEKRLRETISLNTNTLE